MEINIQERNKVYDSRNNCNAIIETSTNTLVAGCKTTIIPESIRAIGDYAFIGNHSLTSIIIPEGVMSIGTETFFDCWSLTSITLPSTITTIEKSFQDCQIRDVYIYATDLPSCSAWAFNQSQCPKATLHVPTSSMVSYRSSLPWCLFGNIETMDYKLTYIVDGEIYKIIDYDYGAAITREEEPTKEGYTFSGWSEIPETMPGHDVTVTGTFTINMYTITYMIDNEVYMIDTVNYGSNITPPNTPSRDGYNFAWDDYPETMPAYDITINGTYTTGIDVVIDNENGNAKIYAIDGKLLDKPQKGINIVRMNDGTVKKIVHK